MLAVSPAVLCSLTEDTLCTVSMISIKYKQSAFAYSTPLFLFLSPPTLSFILSVVCFVIPFSPLQSHSVKTFLSLSVLIMLAPRQHKSTFHTLCPCFFYTLVDLKSIYLCPLYSFSTFLTWRPFNTKIVFARGKLWVLFIYLCFQEGRVVQVIRHN